ncbi:hypothetical protein MKZ38_001603 [Zalerion maritima]|uniref:Uncharacterized protein n=1 Tax=Zalerion maritima TaxID=339359 RepID=A0AAD5WT08_9PEZI|nr:hypothetical protein MKZ38_001603 [Zalerion maritima]
MMHSKAAEIVAKVPIDTSFRGIEERDGEIAFRIQALVEIHQRATNDEAGKAQRKRATEGLMELLDFEKRIMGDLGERNHTSVANQSEKSDVRVARESLCITLIFDSQVVWGTRRTVYQS